ncbi:MAG TPA: DUF3445 domain-containing protein, partial [Geminicoccaceae bacterium]
RRELLRSRRDEVVAATPGSLPAQAEAAERIIAHLLRRFPDQILDLDGALVERASGRRFEPRDHAEAPLALAGALVAEDLCLMEAAEDGYRLTAGVLCFPLHWSLRDKLDRPLGAIHAPVPEFGARLGGPAARFFESLHAARPVWRVNWSLVDTPEPFLPPAHRGSATAFDPERPAATLWFRTERQSLLRLPETGAVLFTIRTRIEPLTRVLEAPGAAPALAARLREMPEPMARYKGILPIREALLAYLDGCSGEAGGSMPSGLTATG